MNHSIYVNCTHCGTEFDLRSESSMCPECGTKHVRKPWSKPEVTGPMSNLTDLRRYMFLRHLLQMFGNDDGFHWAIEATGSRISITLTDVSRQLELSVDTSVSLCASVVQADMRNIIHQIVNFKS